MGHDGAALRRVMPLPSSFLLLLAVHWLHGFSVSRCAYCTLNQLSDADCCCSLPWSIRYYSVDPGPLDRAAAFLLRIQQGDGDWPQQHISGVFNRNCMITYANYRNIFPIWALAKYRKAVAKSRSLAAASA